MYVDTNSDTSEANVAKWKDKSYTLSFENGDNDGWDSFHYVNGDKNAYADPSGTITISKLNIQAPEGTLINNLSSSDDVEFPNKELNTEIVFDGTYKADKQNINLNSFTLNKKEGYNQPSKIRFYLYIDDMNTSVATVTVNKNDAWTTWSDDFNDILVKAGESVKDKVEAEVDANQNEVEGVVQNGEIGKFEVVLEGTDENDNDAWNAKRKTSTIKIVKKWSASVEEDGAAKNVVLRKASSSKIAQFVVKPDSANKVTLEEISFELTFSDAYEWNVDLYVKDADKNLKDLGEGKYKAEFNTEVDSDGVVVTVELDDEFNGEVSLKKLAVNGNEVKNKEFNKKFVEAVVWFASQSSDDDNTTFKFGVDKKSSATIEHVTLTLDGGKEVLINNGNEIKENTPYDVTNGDKQLDVVGIKYTVNGGTVEQEAVNYTAEEAAEYNATLDGAKAENADCTDAADATENCADGKYTADGAKAHNAALDGAVKAGDVKTPAVINGYIEISNTPYADMFKIGMKDDGAQVRVARLKNK